MTREVSHTAATREPVYSGNRRIRGLWQRRRADGTLVFMARLRIDGKDRLVVLEATTKTEAINELESLRVDRHRDELHRQTALTPTLDELAADWLVHLQARVGLRDRRRRYSQRTVDLYRQRLHDHILDELGRRAVNELKLADVRRLVDRLTARGLAPGTVT